MGPNICSYTKELVHDSELVTSMKGLPIEILFENDRKPLPNNYLDKNECKHLNNNRRRNI